MALGQAWLTAPSDPKLVERVRKTSPGMAHFAGTGPAGETCRTCLHWGGPDGAKVPTDETVTSFKRDGSHELRPRGCNKFYRMMQETMGPAVPHDALACRHHWLNKKAPRAVNEPRTQGEGEVTGVSEAAGDALEDMRLDDLEELAEQAVSFWISIREAAHRGERIPIAVHLRQVRLVTFHAFMIVKDFGPLSEVTDSASGSAATSASDSAQPPS